MRVSILPVQKRTFVLLILVAAVLGAGQPAFAQKKWDGPTTGPAGQVAKKIVFISHDFRNGGIAAAYRGFYTAVQKLGWDITPFDGKGDENTVRSAFAEAIRSSPDAILIGGFQADDFPDLVMQAKASKIVLAGWHAAAEPGPTKDLFINVGTESAEVARIAANYAIQSKTGEIGVIIFNDNRFAVANAKTERMKQIVQQCSRCKLLSVENTPISDAVREIPHIVPRLNKQYGKAWTHTLAINDVYFDSMNIPLIAIGREDVRNIAAGDGSNVALGRIKLGRSQQIATVAEPMELQGWQLADEINRAFAGKPPSGYITKPILVTFEHLARIGNAAIDSDIAYKDAYLAIWKGKSASM